MLETMKSENTSNDALSGGAIEGIASLELEESEES